MAAKPKNNVKKTTNTKPAKKAPKKKVAKKTKIVINLFADSKDVNQKQIELKELEKNRKSIEKDIKNIVDNFNAKTFNNSEKFLDKLPIDSLTELQEFLSGKKENNLEILNTRSKLRKDRNQKIEELHLMDKKISEGQIELLLAKINHMINKIDNTDKE